MIESEHGSKVVAEGTPRVQKDDGRVGLSILDEPTWRCHQNPFVGALGTWRRMEGYTISGSQSDSSSSTHGGQPLMKVDRVLANHSESEDP